MSTESNYVWGSETWGNVPKEIRLLKAQESYRAHCIGNGVAPNEWEHLTESSRTRWIELIKLRHSQARARFKHLIDKSPAPEPCLTGIKCGDASCQPPAVSGEDSRQT